MKISSTFFWTIRNERNILNINKAYMYWYVRMWGGYAWGTVGIFFQYHCISQYQEKGALQLGRTQLEQQYLGGSRYWNKAEKLSLKQGVMKRDEFSLNLKGSYSHPGCCSELFLFPPCLHPPPSKKKKINPKLSDKNLNSGIWHTDFPTLTILSTHTPRPKSQH